MDTPLRAALIGYGFIAEKGHLAGYLTRAKEERDVRVVAVADICPARREAARQALPFARIYPDASSLLDGEQGCSDYVDIATPPYAHAQIALAALSRGYHVLCEKPLATDVGDAQAMLSAAQRARRVLFPCHNYKHAPIIKEVKAAIATSRIGRVRLVTLSTFRTTHARGTPDWRPDWRRHARHSGGGIAMDHGSHTFYLAFDWIGAYPTAVTAKMSTLDGGDTEDNFSCALTFPRATVNATLTWTAGVREVVYTLHGERGAIIVDDDTIRVTYRDTDGRQHTESREIRSEWTDASHARWFGSLFEQFRTSIDNEEWVSRDTLDALMCVQTITSAYASANRSCREVVIPSPARQCQIPPIDELCSSLATG